MCRWGPGCLETDTFAWDEDSKADLWVIDEGPAIKQVLILYIFVSLGHNGIWASLLDVIGYTG